MPVFRKGELFNGPGGMSLGAQMAHVVDNNGEEYSIQHIWSNDFDENACRTFAYNICGDENDPSVHCGPVQDLPIGNRDILPNIDCLIN